MLQQACSALPHSVVARGASIYKAQDFFLPKKGNLLGCVLFLIPLITQSQAALVFEGSKAIANG